MLKLYKKYVSVLLVFGMLCVGNISYAAAKGDVNGDGKINILDATMVLNYVQGKISSIDKKAADVNNDGVVNILDATKLLNVVKGKDTLEDPSDVGRISDNQAKEVLFNAVYYANSYPDLKKAFGYDSAKLYEHYYWYGIKEGRSASPVFDPKYYLNNNADLKRAFGNDYKAAYNHWIEWGCSEGRESSQYYSGKYYKNKYGDLQRAYFSNGNNANNYYKLAKHYLEWGINEKRQANLRGLVPNNMSVINPMIGKKLTAQRQGKAYANAALTSVYGNEYVSAGDVVTVLEVSGNSYKVRYPVRNGTKDRWVSKDIFVTSPVQISNLVYPLDGNYLITTLFYYYGVKRSMGYKHSVWWHRDNGGHFNALDIACPNGTKVKAVAAGKVISAPANHIIVIQHDDGMQSLYAHLRRKYVSVGDRVLANQAIGEASDVGVGGGNYHLHLEFSDRSPWEYYRDKVPFKYCQSTLKAYNNRCLSEDKQRFGEAVRWVQEHASHTKGFVY